LTTSAKSIRKSGLPFSSKSFFPKTGVQNLNHSSMPNLHNSRPNQSPFGLAQYSGNYAPKRQVGYMGGIVGSPQLGSSKGGRNQSPLTSPYLLNGHQRNSHHNQGNQGYFCLIICLQIWYWVKVSHINL
jgi:hypothetical protein